MSINQLNAMHAYLTLCSLSTFIIFATLFQRQAFNQVDPRLKIVGPAAVFLQDFKIQFHKSRCFTVHTSNKNTDNMHAAFTWHTAIVNLRSNTSQCLPIAMG